MPPPPAQPAEVNQFVADSNRFALNLFQPLAEARENLIFSPYGLREALAMTGAGAAGATARDFRTALQVSLPEDRLYAAFATLDDQLQRMPGWAKAATPSTFRVTNGLWIDQDSPIEKPFQTLAEAAFKAAVEGLAFKTAPQEAMRRINEWTDKGTDGHIKTLLDQLTPGTRVVLSNAVYFKGGWDLEFRAGATRPGPFSLLPGGCAQAPLMHADGRFDYTQAEGCQALGMNFKEGPFRMVVLLPPRARFQAFEKRLAPEVLGRLLKSLNSHHETYEVKVTLPRFRFQASPPVQAAIQTLGLRSPFTASADFSRMSHQPLKIDEVLHRAFVSVDEKGAEAAAVSAISMSLSLKEQAGQPKVVEFKADHPFVFLIEDRSSGLMLFLGHYLQP